MLRTLSRTRSQPLPKRNSHHQPFLLVTAIDFLPCRQESGHTTPCIPAEILDKIVEFALTTSALESMVDPFSSITSFSLVSSTFRQISLRRYLRDVVVRSREHWDWLYQLMMGYDTRTTGKGRFIGIRSFSSNSSFLSFHPSRLAAFTNLQTLNLNLENEGLHTQHILTTTIFKHLLASNSNCSSSLVKLVLNAVPRIDNSLLSLIALSFPLVSILHITSTDRVDSYDWVGNELCWCCIDDVLDCSFHSAVPEMFPTAEEMATRFGVALRPLTRLQHLLLGVYLSDEGLRWKHILNCLQANAPPHQALEDCISCRELYGREVRRREEVASDIIASEIPSLKTISWHSYFNNMFSRCPSGIREEGGREYVRSVDFDVLEDREATRRDMI
ncbi:hypothetical protein Moror_11660 [Moniliophthora roreri MCA 2997]|uniref:F-box domain-containing protein n=1 Tax=Moniliophthora roreri (strain MCA 2997) TaxID=1381753 RepID=V2X4L2_MONRO|nr:hypothetical protein Moror_11660 [Moniliophthora roreri MCA 2997]